MLTIHKNIPLLGKYRKPIVTDFIYNASAEKKPIVIFCHGYKGFKDWGSWPFLYKEIAKQGFFVVPFNFSHNGGTIEEPIDFPDLEAFGNDNFSKQQHDLQSVIDEVTHASFKFSDQVDPSQVCLIGHSRGGGAAILKAANEPKITALITLAAISTYDTSFLSGEKLAQWKKDGVWYIQNGRTKQEMPHYYQFFQDYEYNKDALDISAAAKKITIPHLIIHGTEDTSVTIDNAEKINQWSATSELFTFPTDHVFSGKHPWEMDKMPADLEIVTEKVISFLK